MAIAKDHRVILFFLSIDSDTLAIKVTKKITNTIKGSCELTETSNRIVERNSEVSDGVLVPDGVRHHLLNGSVPRSRRVAMEMTWVTIAASLSMGLGAAFLFVFAVKRGWFKDIEDAKYQVFWSDRNSAKDSMREAVDGSQSEKK